ncbi:hypothetical protein BANRA_05736 [Klebsiella variicola]|jgi:hypothetical protein|nr:hypothetical protein BANRA_05736 [Klebsiella variicola]
MSKLEYTDNLMLSRQLPLKSVALISPADVAHD